MSEIVVAGPPTLLEAIAEIGSCEKCNDNAVTPFGLVISLVRKAIATDVVFCQSESVLCPNCGDEIWEATLVSSAKFV